MFYRFQVHFSGSFWLVLRLYRFWINFGDIGGFGSALGHIKLQESSESTIRLIDPQMWMPYNFEVGIDRSTPGLIDLWPNFNLISKMIYFFFLKFLGFGLYYILAARLSEQNNLVFSCSLLILVGLGDKFSTLVEVLSELWFIYLVIFMQSSYSLIMVCSLCLSSSPIWVRNFSRGFNDYLLGR